MSKVTGEIVATVVGETRNECVASAILEMMNHVPSMQDAHDSFRLVDRRPPRTTTWQKRSISAMPWGRYEGQSFECIPWRYLDRVLSENLNLRDPILFDAIWNYLGTVDEWRAHNFNENNYADQFNHLRDFDPDELRRTGGRPRFNFDEIEDDAVVGVA